MMDNSMQFAILGGLEKAICQFESWTGSMLLPKEGPQYLMVTEVAQSLMEAEATSVTLNYLVHAALEEAGHKSTLSLPTPLRTKERFDLLLWGMDEQRNEYPWGPIEFCGQFKPEELEPKFERILTLLQEFEGQDKFQFGGIGFYLGVPYGVSIDEPMQGVIDYFEGLHGDWYEGDNINHTLEVSFGGFQDHDIEGLWAPVVVIARREWNASGDTLKVEGLNLNDADDQHPEGALTFTGQLVGLRTKITKTGKEMCVGMMLKEDRQSWVELIVFPGKYQKMKSFLEIGAQLEVRGRFASGRRQGAMKVYSAKPIG